MGIVRFILCGCFVVACSSAENGENQAPAVKIQPQKLQADADVTNVYARKEKDGTWTFHVSIKHPDTGFDDFADGWDLVTNQGTVLKDHPRQRFTKLLRSPHVTEQPFTRTVKGVKIPEGVEQLTVRAHDSQAGFGGMEVLVKLNRRFGKNFTVKHAL